MIAWSRLYVAVHFPTDVICGVLIGILSGWLAYKLYGIYEKRKIKTADGKKCEGQRDE